MKIINEKPHDYDPECICDACELMREPIIPLAKDMTLRDYYVGQMLLGWVKEHVVNYDDPEKDGETIYNYVNDFMKARFIKIKER